MPDLQSRKRPNPTQIEYYLVEPPQDPSARFVGNSYLVYAMVWQTMVCIGGIALIYELSLSLWWLVFLVYLSIMQMPLKKWTKLIQRPYEP